MGVWIGTKDDIDICFCGPYTKFGRWRDYIRGMVGTGSEGDVIWILLNHSDCDGKIDIPHLIPLAQRLNHLMRLMNRVENEEHINTTLRFIRGLLWGDFTKQKVEFS